MLSEAGYLVLNKIYEPIQGDLAKVGEDMKALCNVDIPWLTEMLTYTLSGVGKMIRPALVLLSGNFYKYNRNSLWPMATAVELMHNATLVHDDAIDKSSVRRGKSTINNVWGGEKAVLLGDFLFARAGEFATDTGNLEVVRLFTQTLSTISSGELIQTFNAYNLNQSKEDYIERIACKTASLFCLATKTGAILGQAPRRSVQILNDYGYNLGIAFQIMDDILDFIGAEEELGKPMGSDLSQGTLTLPAMLLMERYSDGNPVIKIFRNEDKNKNIPLAIDMIRNSSIVEECFMEAADYCARARCKLNELPDIEARQSLAELTDYIIKRKN